MGIDNNIKTGLVLEGGAMRGMFTCGITDVFMENGITFDGAAGISAGAAFGCNVKSGQIGRALRYNKKYSRDPRYCSIRSLITTGDMYGVDFCYHELPWKLDIFDKEAFAANPMEFYVGATDIHTGKCAYHLCMNGDEEDFEWIRASASMPLVSRPVRIGARKYLDGGIADSIPYKIMEENGYNRNLIILTQPEGFVKKKNSAMPLMKIALRRYPKLVQAVEDRHNMYNREIAEISEREKSGTVLVMRPPEPLGIKRTEKDPEQLERVYRIGRAEAEKRLDQVREFLKK